MSLAIGLARAEATGDPGRFGVRGDPGIISFAKKVGRGIVGTAKTVGGVVIDIAPGPVGIVARKARGFVRGRTSAADMSIRGAPGPSRVRPGVGTTFTRRIARERAARVARGEAAIVSPRLAGEFPSEEARRLLLPEGETFTPGVTTDVIGCPSGMRPNKSDYFRRSPAGGVVFIEKGTVCVKSRRRNPLNPRALDRAVGRVASFARADSRSRKKIKAAARKIG